MLLIADSGSTKTHWGILTQEGKLREFHTSGINPYYQECDDIIALLTQEMEKIDFDKEEVESLFFYGAGCADETKVNIVKTALTVVLGCTAYVENDLLGAARSLFGNKKGIACILGTGSNSCYYDGKQIVENIPPLGFMLGDEGSGAYLGRALVADYLKGIMPLKLQQAFEIRFALSRADIMEAVYKKAFPNRFLASFIPFLADNREDKYIQELLMEAFKHFFERNVIRYNYPEIPVGIIGSIGNIFRNELKQVADRYDIELSVIRQTPMEGLVIYHSLLP